MFREIFIHLLSTYTLVCILVLLLSTLLSILLSFLLHTSFFYAYLNSFILVCTCLYFPIPAYARLYIAIHFYTYLPTHSIYRYRALSTHSIHTYLSSHTYLYLLFYTVYTFLGTFAIICLCFICLCIDSCL